MPRKAKKTPGNKKKGASSPWKGTTSTRKGVSKATDLDGSFLQLADETVSTVPSSTVGNATQITDKSDAILEYLQKIDMTSQALIRRVSELESNKSVASTPQQPRSHLGIQPTASQTTLNPQHQPLGATTGDTFRPPLPPQVNALPGHNLQAPQGRATVGQATGEQQQSGFNTDGILPGITSLRQNPSISQSVAQIMASYEMQAKQEAAIGKNQHTRKSGRYNTMDTIISAPELRWPNEGYHNTNGKKRIVYDDLSLPEWAVGQLSNIYQIQDPVVVKKALLQTIMALKDATSLPWAAVRSAYANSMHEMEQGTLSWDDQTQWSLNRLSASQIAMANANLSSSQGAHKKICKYYNEGTCTFESNHGNFRHICTFCSKLGKTSTHPETKCYSKQRGQLDKQNSK